MKGWPMNAQDFYEYILLENKSKRRGAYWKAGYYGGGQYIENRRPTAMAAGDVPVYYKSETCSGGAVMITYFAAFGFQHECNACFGHGYHQGGFEQATVV